ncbi:MAG TPA: hypothetical protein VFQ39_03865 [Longimicrobium sp.]|nr:hypothetical protein [Longimicrobium sp.]
MSTTEHLAYAARKAAGRKEYVAFYLDAYQRFEGKDEAEVMETLGCDLANYYRLCLAIAPDFQARSFGEEVNRVARFVNAAPAVLLTILRRAHGLLNLASAEPASARVLMAARDKDPPEPPPTE